jgi:hypothetical protein
VADELERRLREALRAYAEVVDAPDDDDLPVRPATPRPALRRWRGAILVAAAAAAVLTGSWWFVVDGDPGTDAGPAASAVDGSRAGGPTSARDTGSVADQAEPGTAAAPAEGLSLPPSLQPGVAYPVDLYTHCGVLGLDIGGVWFAADPPLVAAGGNPPAGWDNPDQRGTLTPLSRTEAVFADGAGHVVRLRADEAARPTPCD